MAFPPAWAYNMGHAAAFTDREIEQTWSYAVKIHSLTAIPRAAIFEEVINALQASREASLRADLHKLKCWPEPFQAFLDGRKTHEYRRQDRDFKVGDILVLQEWNPGVEDPKDLDATYMGHLVGPKGRGYTGRETSGRVTYITPGGEFGVPKEFCVLSISRIR